MDNPGRAQRRESEYTILVQTHAGLDQPRLIVLDRHYAKGMREVSHEARLR